jgi:hypothetical protein
MGNLLRLIVIKGIGFSTVYGCNSDKKHDFRNLKVATLTFKFMIPLIIRTSKDFRMS